MAAGAEIASPVSPWTIVRRLTLTLAVSAAFGWGGLLLGLEIHQAVACGVFMAIILGTLFFWNFRLAVAFMGFAVLILTRSLNMGHFVQAASLPVIVFLAGMMIVIGALRDLGLFTWIIQSILSLPRITGRKFVLVTAVTAALSSCVLDEVTSIILIATLVFQVCNRLKLNPTPYIIICVLCTNVGSAGTMIGNPVGVYIGVHAGLTFQDFMVWAFPIMIVALVATVLLVMAFYRLELDEFDRRLAERLEKGLSLTPSIVVPHARGLVLLILTLALIASHHQWERFLGLEKNSVLLIAPLISAGIIMTLRHHRARYYVEHEVDWWTLLFFLLLFAVAGTLECTGVTALVARQCAALLGHVPALVIPLVIGASAIISAFVDNVICVAAFAPVIEELGKSMPVMPLWWALLFGACFGGNVTLVGSTANIVALGMLEKHSRVHVRFLDWLKIGAVSGLVACLIAWALLALLSPYMPR